MDERTVRFTCSFMRSDLSRRARILPLYSEAIRRLAAVRCELCTMVTPTRYPEMVAFIRRHCQPYVHFTGETRGTSKALAPSPDGLRALPRLTELDPRAIPASLSGAIPPFRALSRLEYWSMNRQFLRALLVCVAVLPCATALAQGQPPAKAPYEPPAMRFEAKGMSLLEAVKITLQNDPTIKLVAAETERRAGAVRSEKGLFDYVFNAGGSFSYEQTQLADGEVSDLQQTRDDTSAAINEVNTISQSLSSATTMLADKNLIYNNPTAMNLSGIKDANVNSQMALLQSQLITYKDLLASPSLTDAKVRADIAALRDTTIAKNLEYMNAQQAVVTSASKDLETGLDNLGETPEDRWNKSGDFHFDVTKLFRNGLSLKPYGDFTYGAQNYAGKSRIEEEFGGMGVDPTYTGRLGFEVVLPLLRGSGSKSVAAFETAAKYDLEASRLAFLQQQSRSVLATVLAYWRVRAAADELDVWRRSVEIQGELGTITRALMPPTRSRGLRKPECRRRTPTRGAGTRRRSGPWRTRARTWPR